MATPILYCGDVNGDGRVTVIDLLVESNAINRRSSNPLYDMNHDGLVNYADLQMIGQQLGRRCTR
ncbi:MAG: dockerin type I domain-containing protein [Dehalococcoidia bacterium]|jgi:hypothetical protein